MASLQVIAILVVMAAAVCDGYRKELDFFGEDKNFGKTTSRCNSLCKTNEECCRGYTCKRHYRSKIGYCAKSCFPVGLGEDCSRCLWCSGENICTIYLRNEYVCLPRRDKETMM